MNRYWLVMLASAACRGPAAEAGRSGADGALESAAESATESAAESGADSPLESVAESAPDSPSDLPDPSPAHPLPGSGRRALILILDGVRSLELSGDAASPLSGLSGRDWVPELWAAFAGGTILTALQNPGVTSTAPAHTGLFSGRILPMQNVPNTLERTLYRPEVPGLFQGASEDCPAERRLFFGSATLLIDTDGTLYPDAAGAGDPGRYERQNSDDHPDDLDLFDVLKARIRDEDPCLVVVNVHSPDYRGHDGDAAIFLERTQEVVAASLDLRDWLHRQPLIPWRTPLLAITSDHGRHDADWREHGDACTGCRDVPLFLEGPGVPAQVIDEPWTIHDLGGWVADHLGIALPFRDALPPPWSVQAARGGIGGFDVSEGVLALRRLSDDPARRSRIEVEGIALSSPDAIDTAAPAIATRDGWRWVCFLELRDLGDRRPWQSRCLTKPPGGAWTDIGLPMEELSPHATFSLASPAAGALTVAWPSAANTDTQTGTDALWIARYTAASGWGAATEMALWTPLHPSLADAGTPLVLAGGSASFLSGRDGRSVHLYQPDSGLSLRFDLSALLGTPSRVDRASLRAASDRGAVAGQDTEIAAVCHSGDGAGICWWRSLNGLARWSDPIRLPSPWPVLPHLTPRWAGARVVWAVDMDGTTGFCSASGADSAATCASTGAAWADAFDVDQPAGAPHILYVTLRDRDDEDWALRTFPAP